MLMVQYRGSGMVVDEGALELLYSPTLRKHDVRSITTGAMPTVSNDDIDVKTDLVIPGGQAAVSARAVLAVVPCDRVLSSTPSLFAQHPVKFRTIKRSPCLSSSSA
jgi:hypothetical protein